MVYTVYKIVNLKNQKYYIGVHKTNNPNDSYYGSGVAIKNAIKKHGKENFQKNILFITEHKEEAYALEKQLTVDYKDRMSYNLKLGGTGGFSIEACKKGYLKMIEKVSPSEAGKICFQKKAGMFSRSREEFLESSRKGGLASRASFLKKKLNSNV